MAQATVCIHQNINYFGPTIIRIQHTCRINQHVDCICLKKKKELKKKRGLNNLCQVEACLQCDCCSPLQPV